MLMTKKGQGSSYHYLKAKCLGEIMERRAKKAPVWTLTISQSTTGLAEKAEVTEYDTPRSWRIIIPTQDKDISEEVVLRLQGIVCGKDLPPVSRIPE